MSFLSFLGPALQFGGSLLGGMSANRNFKRQLGQQRDVYQMMYNAAQWAEQQPLIREQRETVTGGTTGDVDFKKAVADSEAAGFNPLTAMRAGLFSNYARTSTNQVTESYEKTIGHNAGLTAQLLGQFLTSGQIFQQAPADPWGTALQGLGGTLTAMATQNAANEFDMAKQAAYLKGVSNANRPSSFASLFSIPSVISRGVSAKASGVAGTSGAGGTLNLPVFGPVNKPAGMADMDTITQHFGEPGEWLFFPFTLAEYAKANPDKVKEFTGIEPPKSFDYSGIQKWAINQIGNVVNQGAQWFVNPLTYPVRKSSSSMPKQGGWTIGPNGMFVPN